MPPIERAKQAEIKGDTRKADALLAKAVTIAPGEALVMQGYALFLQRHKRFADAVAAARQAIAAGGERYGAYATLAECCRSAGLLDDAREAILQALAIHPGKPANLALLGRTCAALGRHDEAMAAFAELIARSPERDLATREKFTLLYRRSASAAGMSVKAEPLSPATASAEAA